jgi:p25-alpha
VRSDNAVWLQSTKRMTYQQFLSAMGGCAEARDIDLDMLKSEIAEADGPVIHGTQADAVRFHDERSNRTSRASASPPQPQMFSADGRPVWEG